MDRWFEACPLVWWVVAGEADVGGPRACTGLVHLDVAGHDRLE